ncbi:dTDP-4-dehydrorhamnose reductase [Actinospongicola halichondriae]|uniref:dTDP-4-dehydrorhamnose reductase n=1 Tax=Actinospongicola halichondriae TaxID=3236844 RepID=UPI003D4F7C5A
MTCPRSRRARLDVTRRDVVLDVIASAAPEVVFHAAAWTAVDDCESDPERAFRDNALAARWVAEASTRAGAHLVHVSTDYVFDGTKDGAYTEWDEPNPTSVYGASKLAGEREVRSIAPDSAVVRTSWVMGVHGRNMLKTVLALRDREHLAFVDDQRGSPSFTADLAVGLRHLAERRMAGTFHLTNAGETTWYGLVREILELAGEDPDKVTPISTAELDPPRPAPRPANSVLDGVAWRSSQLPAMPLYRDSLRAAVTELMDRIETEESS